MLLYIVILLLIVAVAVVYWRLNKPGKKDFAGLNIAASQNAHDTVSSSWDSFSQKPRTAHHKKWATDFTYTTLSLPYSLKEIASSPISEQIEGKSGIYTVNLHDLTCTCPDFIKTRSGYPHEDVRRICKHQAKAIIALHLNMKSASSPLAKALVQKASAVFKGVWHYESLFEIRSQLYGLNLFYLMKRKDGSVFTFNAQGRYSGPQKGEIRKFDYIVGQILK